MRLKRYVASSMQQALDQVRQDMGDAALIVQTRQWRAWWKPWGPPKVEVVAALERGHEGVSAPPRARPGPAVPAPPRAGTGVLPGQVTPRSPGAPGRPRAPSPPARPMARAQETVWFDRLTRSDVEPATAWELVRQAAQLSELSGQDLEEALARQVASSVSTEPVWHKGDRPRVAMLVGPTGVGKTTTVAKLAANFSLIGGWKVGLVSTDTFRVGAIQHLRLYADLLGVPMRVADRPERLREILSDLDEELVLVDTTGHSPGDRARLQQVLALSQALPPGSHMLLVVPATLRQADMQELVDAYRPLPLSGVVVSKVDETRRRGALVNAPRWAGKPLAYITTGQGVPDDIEAADGAAVARWVLSPWVDEAIFERLGERAEA
ncbi:MAG: hypothetical protein IMX02_04135 [Limnochordaceae bacterium]|nr:hypothetical protein [Limnochordaceae bacterium]